MQAPVHRAIDAAGEGRRGFAAGGIAPGPDVHHGAGGMGARYQQFQGIEGGRVGILMVGLDGDAAVAVEPESGETVDVEAGEAVPADELADQGVDFFGFVVERGAGIGIIATDHHQLRHEYPIRTRPRPAVAAPGDEAVGRLGRWRRYPDRSGPAVQIGMGGARAQ